jgi:hypothetical protein
MSMRALHCLLALCLCPPIPLLAWGRLGHERVAAAVLPDLPPELADWFRGREDVLPAHVNDPDQWKETDPLEGPRHYLDSEAYGGPAGVPRDRAEAEAKLGTAFQANGQVPWVVQDRVGTLAEAFRAGDPDKVAFQAAILCHYVGDLHVPLHTTVNHDGQLTGQHGVHHRWETGLVERLGDWTPDVRPARLGADPDGAPWVWLKASFAQVEAVLADDLTASRAETLAADLRHGAAYWRAFMDLEGDRVKEQLSLAAQATARMVLLAWTQAGRPPAPEAGSSRHHRT